jgi:hypothetical protein
LDGDVIGISLAYKEIAHDQDGQSCESHALVPVSSCSAKERVRIFAMAQNAKDASPCS